MEKYIIPFVTAFILTAIFVFILKNLAGKINWNGRLSSRHIGKKNVFRVGGVAMILAFNLALILDGNLVITPPLYGVMIASWIILAVGVWDDMKEVFWKTQLFYQISIAMLVYIFGLRIYSVTNPLGGIINFEYSWGIMTSVFLVICWMVIIINSMNWLDGIDGLSGGVALICATTMTILSFNPDVNQPPVAIISLIISGTVLGFLIFNFYPSMIIAGTSGSMFMGFSLSMLAIFSGTKIATAVLVLFLPIADFIWVIGERIRKGNSIFKADKNHLHHKLIELGWSQRKISFLYYSITIVIAGIALNTRAIGKGITLLLAAVIMVLMLALVRRKMLQKEVNKG